MALGGCALALCLSVGYIGVFEGTRLPRMFQCARILRASLSSEVLVWFSELTDLSSMLALRDSRHNLLPFGFGGSYEDCARFIEFSLGRFNVACRGDGACL